MKAQKALIVVCLKCRRRTDMLLPAGQSRSRQYIQAHLACPACGATSASGDVLFDFADGRSAPPFHELAAFGAGEHKRPRADASG